MKRTQLYLDEEMAHMLSIMSRQKGKTISELVRESVEDKYMSKRDLDKAAVARQLAGVWRGRKDLAGIDRMLRRLRKGNRLKRLGIV